MKDTGGDLLKHSKTFIRGALLLLLLSTAVWQTFQWMAQPNSMPIKHVRIEGVFRNLPQEEISSAISTLVQTGFFAVNNSAIINEVTKLEWVNKASIRRVWPDTLVLFVEEQVPVATWNETKLLNSRGETFKPSLPRRLFDLPNLSGADNQGKQVLTVFQGLNDSINELDLTVQQLDLAKHGSWSVVLSNGIEIKVGNQIPEKKIAKSLKVLASFEGELIEHAKELDLRYPNGVSVVWRQGYVIGQPNENQQSFTVKKDRSKKG